MKSVKIIGNVLQIGAGLMFVSSFFIDDNKKATKRRWTSLGVFATGWRIKIAGTLLDKKKA